MIIVSKLYYFQLYHWDQPFNQNLTLKIPIWPPCWECHLIPINQSILKTGSSWTWLLVTRHRYCVFFAELFQMYDCRESPVTNHFLFAILLKVTWNYVTNHTALWSHCSNKTSSAIVWNGSMTSDLPSRSRTASAAVWQMTVLRSVGILFHMQYVLLSSKKV